MPTRLNFGHVLNVMVMSGSSTARNGSRRMPRFAQFLVVMTVTNPEVSPYRGQSMFVVPADAPGIEIVRHVGTGPERPRSGTHAYLRFTDVRVPADHLLGEEGGAFAIAQTRLGGGRVHHAMRTVGQAQRAFDMLCERALSRDVRGGNLASLQMTQEKIADSWIQIEQFRLLVLRTAWLIDKYHDYRKVRRDIAAVKICTPRVYVDVVARTIQIHGSLGISNEMPLSSMLLAAYALGIADGPTEVHKITLAREVLKEYQPAEGSGRVRTYQPCGKMHSVSTPISWNSRSELSDGLASPGDRPVQPCWAGSGRDRRQPRSGRRHQHSICLSGCHCGHREPYAKGM